MNCGWPLRLQSLTAPEPLTSRRAPGSCLAVPRGARLWSVGMHHVVAVGLGAEVFEAKRVTHPVHERGERVDAFSPSGLTTAPVRVKDLLL